MSRFFYPQLNLSLLQINVTDRKEVHHLKNVLRMHPGDTVTLCDGKGHEAQGRIISITSKKVGICLEAVEEVAEPTPRLILACAIPKKSKFETIIEKTTELGVSEIIPLQTKRTDIKLSGIQGERKKNRYEKVAQSAAKQCQRATIPVIHPPGTFRSIVGRFSNIKQAQLIIPSLEKDRKSIIETFQAIRDPQQVIFFIGPEGDFTPEEYAMAREHGCQAVSLGSTVLRVETAAITTIACAHFHFHKDTHRF